MISRLVSLGLGAGTLSFAGPLVTISLVQPPGAGPSRLQLEYLAFPQTVFVNATQALDICLVNGGATGQVINDGGANLDQVVVTIPTGTSFDDLTAAPLDIACASLNPSWGCLGPALGAGQASLTFQPTGVVPVTEGESVCFRLTSVSVNTAQGLTQLGVDQQIDPSRANAPTNDLMRVFKNDLKSVRHDDLLDVRTEQHHLRYTDTDAFQAVLDRDGPGSLLDADTIDGSHASGLLDKATYDSDDDGKVNDSNLLGGLDSSFFLGMGDGHSLDAVDGDPSDAVFVGSNGDVGVGTVTPTATLDVAGRINAQSFTLNGQTISAWPSSLNQVLDYGSSTSTFTTRSAATYYFAHGSAIFSGGSSVSISNLPFTSPSTYTVVAVRNSARGYASQAVTVPKNSGSRFTALDFTVGSSVFWFAFGY